MFETKSFGAQIIDGCISHAESLSNWEGRHVEVTVQVKDDDAEAPDHMDVEKDVYLKMPVNSKVLKGYAIRSMGYAEPSVILPEGIEDE